MERRSKRPSTATGKPMAPRLWPEIPSTKYSCFYPMDRRRGEKRELVPRVHGGASANDRKSTAQSAAATPAKCARSSPDRSAWTIGSGASISSPRTPRYSSTSSYRMRFDEVSAVYALFGSFYVGVRVPAAELAGNPLTLTKAIHIIGGGLAGSEAAWQIARAGVPCRPLRDAAGAPTPAHQTDRLAELVCSNSLKTRAARTPRRGCSRRNCAASIRC